MRKTPVEQFLIALHAGDVERGRTLLADNADVRAAANEPNSCFNSRPVARATKNLPLLDLLLAYGADLNLKSTWWAGGFGLMESRCTPEEAAPLIERGAVVDVFAAANVGMFDRLRELVDRPGQKDAVNSFPTALIPTRLTHLEPRRLSTVQAITSVACLLQ